MSWKEPETLRISSIAGLVALLALISIAVGARPVAGADGGPSIPSQVPGSPVPPPKGPPIPSGPFLSPQFAGSPTDFHFSHFQLYGQGFQPGEHVEITAQHAAVAPLTAMADGSGQFIAYVDFTWVFCGPRGTSAPAPVFHASGDQGSDVTASVPAQPCPELVTALQRDTGTGSGSGGTVSSGTAVAVTAVAISPGPAQPPAPVPPSTPGTLPGTSAIKATNVVEGFGFQPGERVTVGEVSSPGATPAPVSGVADAQGEFQATVTVYVPGPCMSVTTPPRIVATGERGTSASARPAYPPMPMYPCLAPPSNPPTHPGSIPPPNPAATALPPSVTNAPQPSIILTKKVVSAGTVETARIRAPDAEKVRLTVRYPRHAHASWSVTAPSSTTFPVRWTVPRTAHPGVAHLVALFARSNVTLRTSFTIR